MVDIQADLQKTPVVGIGTAVERNRERLSPADERLVRQLLADPARAAFLSAAELASQTGVHEATAVRLAKKLGYDGYPELRADLQAELLKVSEAGDRVLRRLARAGTGDVLGDLIDSERAMLQSLREHVTQDQIDAAARALISAERVFLFGRGHATALVELVDRRLRRSGFATVTLPFEGRDLAEHVVSLRRADAVLAFAFHGEPPGLTPLLEHAHVVGAISVLVSDLAGPLLGTKPTLVLAAPRGADEEFLTLGVPMAISNALVLTIARLDEGRSIETLDQLSGLIARFTGVPEERSRRRGTK